MRDVEVVALRLLAPVVAPTGGHWNAGEIAGFTPDVALSLIKRGVAEPANPQPSVKAPSGPSADKMQKGAPIQK